MVKKKNQRKPERSTIAVEESVQTRPLAVLIAISLVVLLVQLWNPSVYTRELIHLDDGYYVYPLGQMSVCYYLRDWLFRPGTLCFPIRDATFGIDF